MVYTKRQIIRGLRKFYVENGYLPSKKDLCPPPEGLPWYRSICTKFGSLENALQITFGKDYAEIQRISKAQLKKQHRREMRKLLKEEYWNKYLELGYPPTIDQVDADPAMHSKGAYFQYWGMKELLKALGLEESYRRPRSDGREYTEEYLLRALKDKYRRDEAVPTYRGVTADYLTPSGEVYIRRFRCSWDEILRKAGLPTIYKNRARRGLSDEEMIERLQHFAHLNGRTPTAEEVDKSIITPSSSTYRAHFGSFYDALLAAGLKPRPVQESAHKGGLGYWRKHHKNPAT